MRAAGFSLLLSIIGLNGCASVPDSCRALSGVRHLISPGPNGTLLSDFVYQDEPSRVRHLHCLADEGVRKAQVELGRMYETGDRVEQDLLRAAGLYEKAATEVPARTAIYSPPVRLGGSGQVLFLNNPNATPGSAEAKYRLGLMYLEGRGVTQDRKEARRHLHGAAALGHRKASEIVAALPQ